MTNSNLKEEKVLIKPKKTLSLEDRVKKIEDSINNLEKLLEKLSTNIKNKDEKTLKHYEKFVRLFNVSRAKELLEHFETRLKFLTNRLQIELLKQIVLREVGRLYPNCFPFLCESLDNPDDWWQKGHHYTIDEWVKRVKLEQAKMILAPKK